MGTRENDELAGETSNLESPKIRKIGKSVPPFGPPVHTPRGPPGDKTGENCWIGYVGHRKTTSNLSWGYTNAKGPNVRIMLQSAKWSKLCGFRLVAFCEQTGGQFCRFGGAPLRPPGSSPQGVYQWVANRQQVGHDRRLAYFRVGWVGGWMYATGAQLHNSAVSGGLVLGTPPLRLPRPVAKLF